MNFEKNLKTTIILKNCFCNIENTFLDLQENIYIENLQKSFYSLKN